jgi:hypothetical protein
MYEIKNTPANRDEFDRVQFVCKARSNNRKQPYTAVLHIEGTAKGSRLIATDGKRIHVAEITAKIKSGNYKPVVTKDTISFGKPVAGITFPDWTKVLPEKARKRGTIDLGDTGLGKDRRLTAGLTAVLKSFMVKTGEVINLGYLEDLPKTEWDIYKQPGKPILLKQQNTNRDTFAVIVPINTAA